MTTGDVNPSLTVLSGPARAVRVAAVVLEDDSAYAPPVVLVTMQVR